jgi:hypothetical protein
MPGKRGPRLTTIVAGLCAIALLMVPSLLALAGDGVVATVVSGKRLERNGDEVVVATSEEGSDEDPAKGQPVGGGATTPKPAPTGTPTPTPSVTPTASPTPPSTTSGPCQGVDVAPGGDLASAAAGAPAGTTFCLGAGTYRTSAPIRAKNGQEFVGAGRDSTFVTTDSAAAVFDAKGTSGVVWRNLDISGARGSAACKPSCGRGISGGARLVIENVRIHDNANAGIGGTEGGVVISNSELDHNGSPDFVGCCAAGIKSAHGYSISNSSIHDNVGVGVWCDVSCTGIPFEVVGNAITNNQLGGVRFEISSGPAVIKGNVVQGNNRAARGGHGGIEINSSRNAVVEGNTLGGNGGAGIIANGNRSPGLGNVVIANNRLGGDRVSGCGGAVVCNANS